MRQESWRLSERSLVEAGMLIPTLRRWGLMSRLFDELANCLTGQGASRSSLRPYKQPGQAGSETDRRHEGFTCKGTCIDTSEASRKEVRQHRVKRRTLHVEGHLYSMPRSCIVYERDTHTIELSCLTRSTHSSRTSHLCLAAVWLTWYASL
jgi:hypothetical protein